MRALVRVAAFPVSELSGAAELSLLLAGVFAAGGVSLFGVLEAGAVAGAVATGSVTVGGGADSTWAFCDVDCMLRHAIYPSAKSTMARAIPT